jgi:AcrR family transcriptional regulator
VVSGRGHRERLLAAAQACLQEKGYARTTARDLVAASDTNLASIGYHFGSKEALLNEALAETFRTWTAQVEQAVFGTGANSARERLERAIATMIGVFEECRPLLVSFVEALPQATRSTALRERLAASYAESRKAGAAMVTRAADEVGVDPGPTAEAIASVVIAIGDGLMLQWLVDPEASLDARQIVDALAAMSAFLPPPEFGQPAASS